MEAIAVVTVGNYMPMYSNAYETSLNIDLSNQTSQTHYFSSPVSCYCYHFPAMVQTLTHWKLQRLEKELSCVTTVCIYVLVHEWHLHILAQFVLLNAAVACSKTEPGTPVHGCKRAVELKGLLYTTWPKFSCFTLHAWGGKYVNIFHSCLVYYRSVGGC